MTIDLANRALWCVGPHAIGIVRFTEDSEGYARYLQLEETLIDPKALHATFPHRALTQPSQFMHITLIAPISGAIIIKI
jgi:hypothetical protein